MEGRVDLFALRNEACVCVAEGGERGEAGAGRRRLARGGGGRPGSGSGGAAVVRSMAASAGKKRCMRDQHSAHEPHHAASACPTALVRPSPPSRMGSRAYYCGLSLILFSLSLSLILLLGWHPTVSTP